MRLLIEKLHITNYNKAHYTGHIVMNLHNIGLTLLGVGCVVAVLATGFYFQPLFDNYQAETRPFFKQHISKLTDTTTDISSSKRTKETYACPFVFGFFDKDDPIEIKLTNMPNVIQKHPTGITRVEGVTILKEHQIKVFDNQHHNITNLFINKIKERHTKYEDRFGTTESAYNFYTKACIRVRYFRYNKTMYLHPVQPL